MAAVEAEQGPGGSELLKLAAAQRMSTDARRAAFCVVMGSEDYIDASDRLLRLPLKVRTVLGVWVPLVWYGGPLFCCLLLKLLSIVAVCL